LYLKIQEFPVAYYNINRTCCSSIAYLFFHSRHAGLILSFYSNKEEEQQQQQLLLFKNDKKVALSATIRMTRSQELLRKY